MPLLITGGLLILGMELSQMVSHKRPNKEVLCPSTTLALSLELSLGKYIQF